jgi:membrane protease YdiL (CAAX protease family)
VQQWQSAHARARLAGERHGDAGRPLSFQAAATHMTRQTVPAISGLLIAWGGTALLVSPVVQSATDASSTLTGIVGQVALWLLCAAVVGTVVYWEKRPLTSLWLKPFQWQSLAWAGVLVLVSILILFPITEWVRKAVGLPGYAMGMETALAYPGWLRVFAVLTAGVVEETLFRGFAVTRLLQLGAGIPLAVGVSSAVFAALHLHKDAFSV